MTDQVFGEMTYDCGWCGSVKWTFGGKACQISLVVDGQEEDAIEEGQRESYLRFMEQWPELEAPMLDALLDYYNSEERFSYGPDPKEQPEEYALWWPEIQTRQAMLEAIEPEAIVIPWDDWEDGNRRVYLLFGRVWGGEDLDDNGVAVAFLNEQIDGIGYKDIAF